MPVLTILFGVCVVVYLGILVAIEGPKLVAWATGRLNGHLNAEAWRKWRVRGTPGWGVYHNELGWEMRTGGFMPYVVSSKKAAEKWCVLCGEGWKVKRYKDQV